MFVACFSIVIRWRLAHLLKVFRLVLLRLLHFSEKMFVCMCTNEKPQQSAKYAGSKRSALQLLSYSCMQVYSGVGRLAFWCEPMEDDGCIQIRPKSWLWLCIHKV